MGAINLIGDFIKEDWVQFLVMGVLVITVVYAVQTKVSQPTVLPHPMAELIAIPN